MTMMFFMKPHYRDGGGTGVGDGSGKDRKINIFYDESTYNKFKPKRKINPADIHPFFADRPELVPAAKEFLAEGFEMEDILLFFMMTER